MTELETMQTLARPLLSSMTWVIEKSGGWVGLSEIELQRKLSEIRETMWEVRATTLEALDMTFDDLIPWRSEREKREEKKE